MSKKLLALFTAFIMVFTLAACSQAPEVPAPAPAPADTATADTESPAEAPAPAPASDVTLDIWTNMTGQANEAFKEVVNLFTQETGIQVEYADPANDYEALMRTKMATNDLPDVFSTHGWAVMRYGSFLRPLDDQPWASQVSNQIRGVITDNSGNLLVLPADIDIAGMNFNRDILNEVGVSVDDITTWAKFEEVCELVLAAGYIPIMVGGLDDWTLGQVGDWIPPSLFITNETQNHRDEFVNGTFSWDNWGLFYDMVANWNSRGFFNEDALTADYDTITTELGRGNVAFTFFGNYAAMDAAAAGSANIGMMPIPAYHAGDTPTLIAGERLALGVWKDSPNSAEALLFLEFVARPEIMIKLAEANGNVAGFSGVQTDMGFLTDDFQKYSNVRTFPYFDRAFLPSGMWNDLCDTMFGTLNGTMSRDDVINHMERSFNELFSAAE